MLIEMVALTLTIVSGIQNFPTSSNLFNQQSTEVVSPLAKSTPSPTPTTIPTPTNTPVPTPTPTPLPTATPTPAPLTSPDDLSGIFEKYATVYTVDQELLKRIAKCESGFNAQAENGPYAGVFQFVDQTWITLRTRMGENTDTGLRKNAEEAIKTAAYAISNGGQNAWANCL